MKICLLTHTYPKFENDSTAPFMACLAEAYTKLGQTVFVLLPFVEGLRWKKKNPRVISYQYIWPEKLHFLGYSRSMYADISLRFSHYFLAPLMFFFGSLALFRLIKKEKIDIVHAHWIIPNGFLAALVCLLTKTPLVVSIPGSDIQVVSKNFLFAQMALFAYQTAGLVTANSEDLKQAMMALGADVSKFEMVIYGIDKGKMRVDNSQNAKLRKELGLKKSDMVVLAVGRLVYKKGFDVLIQAVPAIVKKNPRVKVVIVGDGDLMKEWRGLAKRLKVNKNVLFAGTISYDRLLYYYNMADVFTMPSVSPPADGLNVCVVEAMACAKPIVATDIAGNPLVVEEGKNGFLVSEKNPDWLAKAILKLASSRSLRLKFGQASRRMVLNKFTWDKIAEDYLTYFEKIVKPPQKLGYSQIIKKILNKKERRARARQILSVVKDHLKTDLKKLSCLDVGCSSGVIASYLADSFGQVTGVDIDEAAIALAKKENRKKNLKFFFQDALKMPFKDNFFDVVVSNQVYNFVSDPKQLMKETYRVLKPGGVCFFGARNKYAPIEPQYKLPFLSWFPHKIAQAYIRITKRGTIYIGDYLSYWQLKRLCSRFEIHDYTFRILANPAKYNFSQLVKYRPVMRPILPIVRRAFRGLVPNYIWILEKRKR